MLRSPLSDFAALRDALDRAAGQALGGESAQPLWSRSGPSSGYAQLLPLDVYATDEQAVIIAGAPGLRPEDLEVTVHQHTITLGAVVGNVADTEEAKGATWYLHELSGGVYRRSVTLPFPIDPERVEARVEHGIVKIIAPKAAHAKPRKIAVSGAEAASSQSEAIGTGKTAKAANTRK